jgi:hypothetical protein
MVDGTQSHEGTRTMLVTRLLADNPRGNLWPIVWLREHEDDLMALYKITESIKEVAEVLGMPYGTVARWFRMDAGAPTRVRLSGDTDPTPHFNAKTDLRTMNAQNKADEEPGIDSEDYVPPWVNEPIVPSPGQENGFHDDKTSPSESSTPGEYYESEEVFWVYQCDLCEMAPYGSAQGLGAHKFSEHGIRAGKSRKSNKTLPSVQPNYFAMMMYWRGKYEALAEALPQFLKAAWEYPE